MGLGRLAGLQALRDCAWQWRALGLAPVDALGPHEGGEREGFLPAHVEDTSCEHSEEQGRLHRAQPVAQAILIGHEEQRALAALAAAQRAGVEGRVGVHRGGGGAISRQIEVLFVRPGRGARLERFGQFGREVWRRAEPCHGFGGRTLHVNERREGFLQASQNSL